MSAHWRKAPSALVHHRSVLLAVFVAALLSALASSSSPFVTTAAASEALKNKLADLSSFAAGVEITGSRQFAFGNESLRQIERAEARRHVAAEQLRARLGHVGRPIYTSASPTQVGGSKGDSYVTLMARTDVLAHVKVLRQVSGPGVFISDITAHDAGLAPGDVLRVDALEKFNRGGTPHLRVKGVYRALAHSPNTDYWGNFFQDIYPQCLDCNVPPPFLFVSPNTLAKLVAGRDVAWATFVEMPADPRGITLGAARSLDRKIEALRSELRHSSLGEKLGCAVSISNGDCKVLSSLDAAVILADRNANAVTPAVTLLADLGTGIALAVAAAAGIFLVRRRRAEAALLYARGEPVGVFAARTLLEVLAPTLAGGAAGFALAYVFTDVFAPSGSIAAGTVWSGVAHAAVAVAIGIALLVACAAASFLQLYDTGVRGTRWVRWLPWEAALLAAALVLYLRIRSGGAVTHGASHAPTLAVFVFPLLLVAAVAGIAARFGRLGLQRGSRAGRGLRPPLYLALRRLGAARGLVVVLAVVTAAALGAFFYVETLASSLHQTTLEKAYMATGSDAQAIVQDSQLLPRSFPYPITRVQFSNQNASLPDGTTIDVMLVDPATLLSALHWQGDWGASPQRALRTLASARSQPLPVIVTSDLVGARRLVLGGSTFRMRVLASVRAFPFMAQGIPLVITSYDALHDLEARTKLYGSLGVVSTFVWGKGPPKRVGRALAALEPTYPPSTIDTFLHAPDVVLATRTFTFMRLIAVGAGVLALLGLLLYLQARQRSQAIASALARRMGFARAAETFSLCVELVGLLAFAAVVGGGVAVAAAAPVVRRIDPLPDDPPGPIFTVPTWELVLAAVGLVLVAVAAGALTSFLARRADVSEALRVA
jgi:putative ABC transport system permease protein